VKSFDRVNLARAPEEHGHTLVDAGWLHVQDALRAGARFAAGLLSAEQVEPNQRKERGRERREREKKRDWREKEGERKLNNQAYMM
jgi:hypothetical protein